MFLPDFEKYLTILYYGPRSSGKTLHQAKTTVRILKYLDKLQRKFPSMPQAIVCSNQKFNAEIENKYLGVKLFYWENIRQLRYCMRSECWKSGEHRLHDAYIIFDDIATIIPADGWKELPRWFRKTFSQAAHFGIHCVANVQDPVSCDINFRRYVDMAWKFQKLMGSRRPEAAKPKPKMIWGFYSRHRVDAATLWNEGDLTQEEIKLKHDKEKALGIRPKQWIYSIHWIGKKASNYYDTLQDIPEYMPNTLEHIEMRCEEPNCTHRDRIRVIHRVI